MSLVCTLSLSLSLIWDKVYKELRREGIMYPGEWEGKEDMKWMGVLHEKKNRGKT